MCAHIASVYTVTSERRFETTGTVFLQQRETGLYKIRNENELSLFTLQYRKLQKEALARGESRHGGYLNTSLSRWGESIVVVPNYANRIAFYHSWRPHSAWIPSHDQLSDSHQNGRLTLNSFWRMHALPPHTRWSWCQNLVANIPKHSTQGLASACDKCSRWRECAWHTQAKMCAPSTCVYGMEVLAANTKSPELFFCNESIGIHSANGMCAEVS